MDRGTAIWALEALKDTFGLCKSEYGKYTIPEALDLAIEALSEPITIRKVVLEPTNPETLWEQGMRSFDGLEAALFVKEKYQLSGETSTKLKNPDDSLLTEDSEACKEQKSKLEETPTTSKTESVEGVAESATTTDCNYTCSDCKHQDKTYEQEPCHSCFNNDGAGYEPDTDCISRQQAVEAVTNTIREKFSLADWYEQLVETGLEIENLIKELPPVTPTDKVVDFNNMISAGGRIRNLPPVTPKEQQEHGRLIDADKLLQETFTVDEEEWTTPEIRAILENAPSVTPTERPKTTETMMVDGEPTEIDPLSYEVGYTHGQSERPKGVWVEVEKNEYDGFSIVNMRCNQCGRYAYLVLPKGTKCVYDYCPWCQADMRGDKE